MKLKRLAALILCGAFTLGICGCDKTGKNTKEIEDVLGKYVDSMRSFDSGSLLDLTNWEEDDKEYKDAKELINPSLYEKEAGADVLEIYKYVASTISVDYKSSDINIEGNKATVKVKYEVIGWTTAFADPADSCKDVIEVLKNSNTYVKTDGKITLERGKDGWKIYKIPELREVFSFLFSLPCILEAQPTGSDPTGETGTEPTLSQPSMNDFEDAIAASVSILDYDKDNLNKVEKSYYTKPVGICDMNNDGLYELFCLTSTSEYSVRLSVRTYLPYAGEMVPVIEIDNIMYMAADGGSFLIYLTDKELIIHYYGGEDLHLTYKTNVYSLKDFSLIASYVMVEDNDYDFENSEDHITYTCTKDGKSIPKAEYDDWITGYVTGATQVLAKNYDFSKEDLEYPLRSKTPLGMMSYDDAIKFLKSKVKDN